MERAEIDELTKPPRDLRFRLMMFAFNRAVDAKMKKSPLMGLVSRFWMWISFKILRSIFQSKRFMRRRGYL
jgi:hypothetical protein